MRKIQAGNHSAEDIERYIKRIPFFNEVEKNSANDFKKLLSLAEIIQLQPSQTVINKGDNDRCLYFLLKGKGTSTTRFLYDKFFEKKIINFKSTINL